VAQNHAGRLARLECFLPARCTEAPTVANKADFVQALSERKQTARELVGRLAAEKSDQRHRRLLRPPRERPRGRGAAEQRDEFAPFYLIELHSVPSARAGL